MPELQKPKKQLSIAMFPFLAMGHIIPYFQLATELAKRGNKVSLLLTNKPIQHLNGNPCPDLLKFHTLKVPPVEGLPAGVEIISDIDMSMLKYFDKVFDGLSVQVSKILQGLKPDVVFYDFANWIPDLAAQIGFKTVCYHVICASYLAIGTVPTRKFPNDRPMTVEEVMEVPEGYPSSTVVLNHQDARALRSQSFSVFDPRLTFALQGCDIIGIRTCRELEGPMCDYLQAQFKKPVLLSGPFLPDPSKRPPLEDKWDKWLNKFKTKSVIYSAFGSQKILHKDNFQQLVLGLEMTGMPFFVAISKLIGANSIEEALPEGFVERVGDRGVVHGRWVDQTQMLNHPSVGCFVSHCGFGSMWESLLSDKQIVLVPWIADQMLNTRRLVKDLKVAVEVERGELGWFSKENICKAVISVMKEESEVGKLIQENHAKLKDTLTTPGFMGNYVDGFINTLCDL